jgi:hypothetical protein
MVRIGEPNPYMKSFCLNIFLFIFCLQVQAASYYSRNSGGNWSTPGTWSTAGYGGAASAVAPSTNDSVKIGDGYTVVMNANSSCAQLDIGQGASGILQYSNSNSYSLTIGGNVTINPGATFVYSSNNTRTHTLLIGGNFTNNGTVNFYFDSNDLVNLTFNGSATGIVSGSGTWTLNTVTIGKASSAAIVEVQATAFETAIVTLTATTGTYIHNNSGSYSINNSVSVDFSINQNMVFKVPQGTVTFSPNTTRTYLYGSLYVNGGNVFIGNNIGTNGLRYDKVGTNIPYLEVSSGSLTVYGGITYSASDPFSFNMTGGTILLNCGTSGTSSEVFLVNDVATSVFSMSDGTITIQKHNSSSGSNSADWTICGSSGTVTTLGGIVQFGNASSTATSFDFVPFANVVQPNFVVSGPSGTAITLQTSKGATTDFKLLSLSIEANKTFDVTSIAATGGNTKRMTITSTSDGSYSFYNNGTYTARSGRVIFGGTSTQSIGGSTTTDFYDLTINNPGGVTLGTSANVTDSLLMSNGIMTTTSTNILTCTSTGKASIGSSSSYIDGPMIHTMALSGTRTLIYPIGKSGDYRPAVLTPTHSSATSVTYRCEVVNSPASALSYTLPSTLSSVSSRRYWLMTRSAVANFTSATLQLYYGANDGVLDYNSLRVAQGIGASWADHGGVGTANGTGNITSSAFASFNTVFTIGNSTGGGNYLPVTWLDLEAKPGNAIIYVNWKTALEINNDFFTVERSPDGINFIALSEQAGAGNSNIIRTYQYIDENPLTGINFYRIKQTDFDGSINYSSIVKAMRPSGKREVIIIPSSGNHAVDVILEEMKNEKVWIVVSDLMGSVIKEEMLLPESQSYEHNFSLPANSYNSIYFITVQSESFTETKRFFMGN